MADQIGIKLAGGLITPDEGVSRDQVMQGLDMKESTFPTFAGLSDKKVVEMFKGALRQLESIDIAVVDFYSFFGM